VLTVNQNGSDRLNHTFPDTSQEDQERGQTKLYEVNVAGNNIIPEDLNNSSIRIGIRGDDLWQPEHVVIWGERLSGGAIIPVAVETDLTVRLSTDAGKGNLSLPLRRVASGAADMPIRRLLMLMTTANRADAGTNSGIELQVFSDGALVVDFDVPDTPHEEQERGQANFYFVPVAVPFAQDSLDNTSIRLRIKGDDAWLPGSFFLFGLDDAAGWPEALVPLVHLLTWPHGQLSTDSGEGVACRRWPWRWFKNPRNQVFSEKPGF
jgi:hypothetical protein